MRQETLPELILGIAIRPIMMLAAATLALSSATAMAGFITIDQAGISAIFSQPSFDGTPIDIRFNPPRLIVGPELLDINSQARLTALVDLAPDPAPIVDAFFVDQLNACGFEQELTVNGSLAGLSAAAAPCLCRGLRLRRTFPAPLMGHELGHSMYLQHDFFDLNNLMTFSSLPGRRYLRPGRDNPREPAGAD